MAAQQPLFGILPAGQPLITQPTSQPTPTSFLYAIPQPTTTPAAKPFSHLAVFLLPGVAPPDGTAAAIYVAQNSGALLRGESAEPVFRFLGGVGPGKESAVFKLNHHSAAAPNGGVADESAGDAATTGEGVVIGVSFEPAVSVAERIQQQQQHHQIENGGSSAGGQQQPPQRPSTQVLAQRIIQNAYNFLSSFSGQVGEGGVEVVPLKAFQEWWRKFEGRVRSDPTFLEREQE
ncbi:hypothetical protein DL764_005732 [Monosporascus ibericus]|uniref:Uncharacterized protein n=1 Tax=Monosporascus ibericus TaxID=155417 RepID=A0A4Q4T810_9PEZI|nr:hypothetical protein DL764_005732 [Monosporascus ibericus]